MTRVRLHWGPTVSDDRLPGLGGFEFAFDRVPCVGEGIQVLLDDTAVDCMVTGVVHVVTPYDSATHTADVYVVLP